MKSFLLYQLKRPIEILFLALFCFTFNYQWLIILILFFLISICFRVQGWYFASYRNVKELEVRTRNNDVEISEIKFPRSYLDAKEYTNLFRPNISKFNLLEIEKIKAYTNNQFRLFIFKKNTPPFNVSIKAYIGHANEDSFIIFPYIPNLSNSVEKFKLDHELGHINLGGRLEYGSVYYSIFQAISVLTIVPYFSTSIITYIFISLYLFSKFYYYKIGNVLMAEISADKYAISKIKQNDLKHVLNTYKTHFENIIHQSEKLAFIDGIIFSARLRNILNSIEKEKNNITLEEPSISEPPSLIDIIFGPYMILIGYIGGSFFRNSISYLMLLLFVSFVIMIFIQIGLYARSLEKFKKELDLVVNRKLDSDIRL